VTDLIFFFFVVKKKRQTFFEEGHGKLNGVTIGSTKWRINAAYEQRSLQPVFGADTFPSVFWNIHAETLIV
jgi:hypothetical protein